MSSDEPAETPKRRRRRRSLRVPVDEVPRPTQALDDGGHEGAETMEIPAISDEPAAEARTTLEDLDPPETTSTEMEVAEELDPALLGAPRTDDVEAPLDAGPTIVRESPLEDEIQAARAAAREPASLELDVDDIAADEPAPEPDPGPPIAKVVVQRVVAIASWPPPPLEDPEVRATEPGTDLEDFDVELDADDRARELAAQPAPAERDSAPELEPDDLLTAEPEEPRSLSNRPPPPPKAAPVAAAPAAEKPKEEAAAPEPAPQTRKKKAPRNWWEELFNDDYLRTVPIPHPRTISRQADFIEQRFGLSVGATILDVGCGLGLHAVELTRRGYVVVGLDLSLPMLSRAADEAQEHGFKINFLHADMREMTFEGAFDAVLCWGTTLGYFDDDGNKLVAQRLYHALKPRGLLLLDVVNRDFVLKNQPNLVWFEGDGCVVMEETQCNYITSRLQVKRTVILDDGRQRESVYSLRLYSLHELGQLLHQQGFRVVEVTGREAHPGVFFGADSPKLLILAERRPAGPPVPPKRAGDASEPPSGAARPDEEAPELAADDLADLEPSEAVAEAVAAAVEQSGERTDEPD